MQRVLQFDMKHWTKSCKSSCELELQTRYFCSYNQEYRDSIDSDISDNPLSVLDFSELVDWIPRHDKGLEIMRKENEYGRDTPLKDLHTSLVENFTFRFIQLNKNRRSGVGSFRNRNPGTSCGCRFRFWIENPESGWRAKIAGH